MSSLFSDITNFVDRQLGVSQAINQGQRTSSAAHIPPWDTPGQRGPFFDNEAFWKPFTIDTNRWNRLYPYRLLVVDVSEPGTPKIVRGAGRGGVRSKVTQVAREQGIEYIITQVAEPNIWECVLPITPQQLAITDQFAISTTATMRGVVEEHNGVKFKLINISGTTGIWNKKPTKGGNISTPTSLGSVFAGTLGNVSALAQNVQRVATAFSGQHPNQAKDAEQPGATAATEFSTGYYQALYLGQFMERYAQAKKDPRNKGWRLVMDMPKRNVSYVVSPIAYTSQQSEQRPNEYLFNMQLKAWKRIDLRTGIVNEQGELPKLEANLFQRVVNTIRETRRTLSSATNLVKAVRSDFRRPFEILRQTALAVKDLGGLAFSVADLPSAIIADAESSIEDIGKTLSSSFSRGPAQPKGSVVASTGGLGRASIGTKLSSPTSRAGATVNLMVAREQAFEGLSSEAVAAGALGDDAAQSLDTSPLNNVFENPEENFEFFDSINLDDLTLTEEQQNAVQDEIERIELITIQDLRDSKQELLDLALEISNNFGAGDQTYSNIYNRQDPRERVIDMTVEENEILASIYESIQAFDLLTATRQWDDFSVENPLEYVGGLANEADIPFEDFPSKMLVPVPFGLTIEQIAARYMDNADKWLEIVTVNKLRSPYIDEEGFVLNFLSNAEGRQFNVEDSENRLFLGQRIVLQSDTVPPFSRKIINIEEIGANNILITVDGEDNLDNLTLLDNARMQGYLPGTVNSQNQIYIPVNLPAQEDDRVFDIPQLDEPSLTKVSKVDFLLTENNDIAINSVGDFRVANGLTNLIQAMKLKIITQKGTLLRHLDYGLGIKHGVSVADIENGIIVNSLNQMIENDPRFDSVDRIDITLNGSTLNIQMSVVIANNSGVVPITFNVNVS